MNYREKINQIANDESLTHIFHGYDEIEGRGFFHIALGPDENYVDSSLLTNDGLASKNPFDPRNVTERRINNRTGENDMLKDGHGNFFVYNLNSQKVIFILAYQEHDYTSSRQINSGIVNTYCLIIPNNREYVELLMSKIGILGQLFDKKFGHLPQKKKYGALIQINKTYTTDKKGNPLIYEKPKPKATPTKPYTPPPEKKKAGWKFWKK